MAQSATGITARIRQFREATYNTAPTADFWNIPFISANLGTVQQLVSNPVLGQGSDPQEPDQGVLDGKGDLTVPLDARYIGLHLAALLGDPTTTAPTGHHQHVFNSGGTGLLTSQALEVSHPNLTEFFMNTGIFFNSMDVSLAREGKVQVKFGVIGTEEAVAGTTGAGTPADFNSGVLSYFSHLTAVLKWNGTAVGNITGGGFSFSNNIDPLQVVANNGMINGADRGQASLTGKLSARLNDMTLYNAAKAGTIGQIDWILSNSADQQITFSMPKVKLSRPQIPITGPGGVVVNFDLMGFADPTHKMLTATLLNDLDGTAYAS
jgi:hypothetical protein